MTLFCDDSAGRVSNLCLGLSASLAENLMSFYFVFEGPLQLTETHQLFDQHMASAESPTAPSAASTFAEDAQWAAAYTVVFSTFAPIVIAFCYSPYSAFFIVLSLPLFTLLIPLTVGLFGTYAFSRLSDLSYARAAV